jgi:hypothetical protein
MAGVIIQVFAAPVDSECELDQPALCLDEASLARFQQFRRDFETPMSKVSFEGLAGLV